MNLAPGDPIMAMISPEDQLNEEDLDNMHKKKTGELIKASLVVGCILSGINKDQIKTIDLHGLSLENANKVIEEFITQSFKESVNKIIVITGKGLRSKNINDPYQSNDLSILKHFYRE